MLLLFLLLLTSLLLILIQNISYSHQQSQQQQNKKPINIILTNTLPTISAYGPYLNNISIITPASSLLFTPDVNISCNVIQSTIFTEPCRIQYNRTYATVLAQILAGTYYATNELCETDVNETCTNGDDTSLSCYPLTDSSMCTYLRLMMRLLSPTPSCFSIADINLVSFACGVDESTVSTHYCKDNVTCVDARAFDCNSSLSCTLSTPFLSPANYSNFPLATTYVLPFPFFSSICSSVSCALPLIVTLSTPLFGTPVDPPSIHFFSLFVDVAALKIYVNATYLIVEDAGEASFVEDTGFEVILVPEPQIYSLCPSLMLAKINSTVVVQGSDFYPDMLRCFFGDEIVPVSYLDSNVVHCYVYTDINKTTDYPIRISNDGGATFASNVLYVTVIGSCATIKLNSVPVGDSCVCPPGYYDVDGSACIPCGNGFYQPSFDQSACIPCDTTMDTSGQIGSISDQSCVCKIGYYPQQQSTSSTSPSSSSSCLPCTEGMDCIKGGNQIGVMAGYWRAKKQDMYALPCPGGIDWCKGGFGSGDELCRIGYMSPLCSSCDVGYGNFNNQCYSCGGQAVNIVVVTIIVILSLVVIFGMFHFSSTEQMLVVDKPIESPTTISPVIRIMFSYLQSLYYIGQIAAGWSALSKGFFIFFVPISISSSFIAFRCALPVNFYVEMMLVMMEPVFVCIIMVGVVLCTNVVLKIAMKKPDRCFTDVETVSVLLIALFLVHPSIALEILQSLSCRYVHGTNTTYVATDMRVNCESGDYKIYRVIAILYFVIYIIGGCAIVAKNIRDRHSELRQLQLTGGNRNGRDWNAIYLYFIQGYTTTFKPSNAAWEMVVMVRKIIIVACGALLTPSIGLVWVTFMLFISLLFTERNSPYYPAIQTYIDLNVIEFASLGGQLATLLLAFHSLYFSNHHIYTDNGTTNSIVIFVFLVLINGSIVIYMISMVILRVRLRLHKIKERIVSFFSFTQKKPHKEIQMYSRNQQLIQTTSNENIFASTSS
jgi:hypothetical protein